MSEVLPELGLVLVLVVINAAFAGTELALVSLREAQLQRLENQSATGAVLARLARQPNQFLATIQIEDHAGRLPGVGRCCSIGRIPNSPGDVIDIDDWHLEVMGLHRRTITEIRLRHIAHQGPGGGASGATTSDTHRQETDR